MLLVQPNNEVLWAGLAARASSALLGLKGHQQCLSALCGLVRFMNTPKSQFLNFPGCLRTSGCKHFWGFAALKSCSENRA